MKILLKYHRNVFYSSSAVGIFVLLCSSEGLWKKTTKIIAKPSKIVYNILMNSPAYTVLSFLYIILDIYFIFYSETWVIWFSAFCPFEV